MANSQIIKVKELKINCRLFMQNHFKKGVYPIIEFRVNRSSSYKMYIACLNKIKATFNELWNEEAQRLYNAEYKNINLDRRRIRMSHPMILVESNYNFNPNAYW